MSGYSGSNQALIVGGIAEDLLYSNTISDLLNAELPQKSVVCLQGEEATVQLVVEELPRSLIAHFDTHGIYAASAYDRAKKLKVFQSETPQNAMLFSALELAQPTKDCNLNTSILAAYFLSEIDLSTLELAVLAACESSMGNDRFGEGRFSLGRAFHLAGCRDVIGSLWKVDDFATSQLMIAFYKNLLQGKTATESLRSAQLAILNGNIPVAMASSQRSPLNKDRKTTLPATGAQQSPGVPIRYWAAFQLSGPGDRPVASRLQGKD